MMEDSYDARYCSHSLDYEKKSAKITWLRCRKCNCVVAWLEDTRQRVEGKPVKLSYIEKEMLK